MVWSVKLILVRIKSLYLYIVKALIILDNLIFCNKVLSVFNLELCIISVEQMPLSLNLKISENVLNSTYCKAPKGLMKSSEGILNFKF